VALNPPVAASVRSFARAIKAHPSLTEVYDRFGRPFERDEAEQAVQVGTTPIIQLNPRGAPLARIAAGKYDTYLLRYGKEVKAFHCQLIISFAHEMNGSWYPWGCHHTSAAVFVAAWRHVETVIKKAGANNVIWMWTTNVAARGYCPLASRYPGNKYVTWVGLDGYLRDPGNHFNQIFGRSLARIRQFSDKPILLAETGVLTKLPGAPARIRELFLGAAQSKDVIGVVYFDLQTQAFGDYRPQDNPITLAAFRKAAAAYLAG
jgi:mannan endo-1,4-beta-mannosidase